MNSPIGLNKFNLEYHQQARTWLYIVKIERHGIRIIFYDVINTGYYAKLRQKNS